MPGLEPFNPSIDRYDHRSVTRMFRLVWPDTNIAKAVAENLAASIRIAHAASDACWEITMYPDGLRLNVGQVETLTFWENGARFLYQSPLEIEADLRYETEETRIAFYAAVPIPSGVCWVDSPGIPSLQANLRQAHNLYIETAASFKRSSPFKASHSPAVLEYLEFVLGTTLPRPSYTLENSPQQNVVPLPDELDLSQPIVEGAKYQITVNAYERDPKARQLCIAHYGTTCVICGFSFGKVYGAIAEGFIHVHHVHPLSEMKDESKIDPVKDLRPVCPNCHAVLHRRVPAFSIEEVKEFLKQGERDQRE